VVALLALGLTQPVAQADEGADSIIGIWHTTGDKSEVQIVKRGGRYYGQIVSLKEPNWPPTAKPGLAGTPKKDKNNPDPTLRGRLITGIEVMSDFLPDGKDHWDEGKIYDPENGKTYKSKMTLTGANRLEVRGYIGISLIGRTVVWTR